MMNAYLPDALVIIELTPKRMSQNFIWFNCATVQLFN